jgi:hypothetical protein
MTGFRMLRCTGNQPRPRAHQNLNLSKRGQLEFDAGSAAIDIRSRNIVELALALHRANNAQSEVDPYRVPIPPMPEESHYRKMTAAVGDGRPVDMNAISRALSHCP